MKNRTEDRIVLIDDTVVATVRHRRPTTCDLERRREALLVIFDVDTLWLCGQTEARDTITVQVDVYAERLSGGRVEHVVEPAVRWTRTYLRDDEACTIRGWSEEPYRFKTREEALAAAEGLLGAVTTDPGWLRVAEDYLDDAERPVETLAEARAIVTARQEVAR